jgi:hypothetical protein
LCEVDDDHARVSGIFRAVTLDGCVEDVDVELLESITVVCDGGDLVNAL